MAKTVSVEVPGADRLDNRLEEIEDVEADHEARTMAAAARAALDEGDDDAAEQMLQRAIEAKRARKNARGKKAAAGIRVPESLAGDDAVLAVAGAPVGNRDSDSMPYGPELPWAAGTLLDEHKQPCAGGADPRYYVGRILHATKGWYCSVAVPLA